MTPLIALFTFLAAVKAVYVPGPTGPLPVAMTTHELTDLHRQDPYAPPDSPHLRKIMISVFQPAGATNASCRAQIAPYMPPLTAASYESLAVAIGLSNDTFDSFAMQLCEPLRCRKNSGAGSFESRRAVYPVVLFSPGSGNSRLLYGGIARDLASYGYAVISIDHPYDPPVVEFLDGTVIYGGNIPDNNATAVEASVQVRMEDVFFLLQTLRRLQSNPPGGKNTATPHIPVSRLDLNRVAMAGHSIGGSTAAAAMLSEPGRIRAGIDLDGQISHPVLDIGLDQPFMLVGRPNHTAEDPTWDAFWKQLSMRGAPRALLAVNGTQHGSFTDVPTLLTAVGLSSSVTGPLGEILRGQFGAIDWTRVQGILSRVIVAFLEFTFSDGARVAPVLTSKGDPLLPEVDMIQGKL
ncbi:alpha/beta-hydrolase [Thozetella sp. PMI_491]|nr:alpha/beta-hydrolase [Thozetella sp. PMI_491]